jgi:hypothetical protein
MDRAAHRVLRRDNLLQRAISKAGGATELGFRGGTTPFSNRDHAPVRTLTASKAELLSMLKPI